MLTKGFFQLARSASKNSNYKVRLGCVIALHGKPVSVGWNVVKSHPLYTGNSDRKTIHAEIKAIINAQCDLTGGIAYVYREYATGKPALAKPCDLCYTILAEAGVKKVFYTVSKYPYWKSERIK